MGVRGEIFSTKVNLQNRTYFFNVKENRLGDLYLNIVESKNRDTGGFDRQSVILFADDLGDFLKGFDSALRVLEKAVREKKRGAVARQSRDAQNEKEGGETVAAGSGTPNGQRGPGKTRLVKKAPKESRQDSKPRKPRAVRAVKRQERD
ncbi:MAG: DUF3276 family protein [Spirochaetaceae bacterium]|jgi:hypothetical protein|nr:DUF3276 family protein [Spirochaetaceae bacterium]